MGGVRGAAGKGGRRRERLVRGRLRVVSTRITEFIVQAIVDFMVDDVCVLCGRDTSAGPVHPRTDTAQLAAERPLAERLAGLLCRPTRHRYMGALSIINHPVCASCARGLPTANRRGLLGTVLGSGCMVTTGGAVFVGPRTASASPPAPAVRREIGILAPFMTDDNPLKLVHLVKFSRHVELAVPMGMAMAEACRSFGRVAEDGVVVPVPMCAADRRLRGFNQAEALADAVGERLRLPVVRGALEKAVATAPQSATPTPNRAENIRGAFRCRLPRALEGRPVLLVDDLVTTGATAGACAAVLLAAGTRSVDVVCFARAL
jgi:ComF family protein